MNRLYFFRKEDVGAGRYRTKNHVGHGPGGKAVRRVLKAAIAAALQKMEHSRNTPKVGRNSMKRLTARDPGASTIEVTGRIALLNGSPKSMRSAITLKKTRHGSAQMDGVFQGKPGGRPDAAFKEYTRKDLARSTRPSLLSQLAKFKELAQALGRDKVKNKEHGGPER